MNQGTFFDDPKPVQAQALSRRSDPETSREAAEKLVASGKLHAHSIIALNLVVRFPKSTGGEIDELAHELYGLKGRQASKRLSGIDGMKSGEARKCRVGGNKAKVWWLEAVE